jgi:hypothetical protein
VANGRLVISMIVRQMDVNVIRWIASLLSERMVQMIIERNTME